MSKTFQIEIITPNEIFPPRNIISINLPTDDGRITVLANHQPLICSLTKGETVIITAQLEEQLAGVYDSNERNEWQHTKEETWLTDQGVITVEKNKAELLIRSAEML